MDYDADWYEAQEEKQEHREDRVEAQWEDEKEVRKMSRDTRVWFVHGQLNGCYLPDYIGVFDKKEHAIADARSMAEEYVDGVDRGVEIVEEHHEKEGVHFFFCGFTDIEDSVHYPYYYKVVAMDWREVARDLLVRTRREVLEFTYL